MGEGGKTYSVSATRAGWALALVGLVQSLLTIALPRTDKTLPLREDLRANAQAAAFDDPRFPPLNAEELDTTRVEVSVLSRPEPLSFADEADCLAQLRPGVDGVILEYGWHRATFLPQVWEQLPEPRQFMAHLKRKAGLAPDFWSGDLRLSRYGVEKFKEAAS